MTIPSFISGQILTAQELNQALTDTAATVLDEISSGNGSLVGYNQGGSGSVQRSVQNTLQQWVSVLDFGADPTGVKDSLTAFSNAANFPFVIVPTGNYSISSSIARPAGVTFMGQGRAKTIITATGNFPIFETVGSSTNILVGGGVQRMTLFGSWGSNNANTSSYGVSEAWTNRSIYRDLEIYGCYIGMYGSQGLWQVVWDNITADGEGANQNYIGFKLDALPDTLPVGTSNAVIASNCIAQEVAYAGYLLINPNGSKFVNCEADNGEYGWIIGGSPSGSYPIEFINISNCLADTCSQYGWYIYEGGSSSPVTDMQFSNCWAGSCRTGVGLSGCKRINLSNFQSSGHQQGGVLLENSSQCLINGWQLDGNNISAASGIGDITISGGSYNIVTACVSRMANSDSVSFLETNDTTNNYIYNSNLFQSATLLPESNSVIRACPGFFPSNSSITAGASPYLIPTVPYDATYIVTNAGGMTALTLLSTDIQVTAGTAIFVKANQQITATWSSTPPVLEICPQV